ncbi:MAG: zinc ABC transporter substrate-binding protein [Candidatus Rokuibacteriota bacterium]|nr:MAG: zinc ABC transporter substrate-binding protein [Candidatus Rokubacteria bacterium]
MVGKRARGRRARRGRTPHLIRRAALAAALALFACNQGPAPSGQLLVVASFYPLYEFARQVTGPLARVVSLVPPGVEPHDWEPSPQDLTRIRDARLFIYNGAGLEPWVAKLVSDPTFSRALMVRATEGIQLLSAAPAEPSGSPSKVLPDPHVWLDPVLAQSMVETIRAALVKLDPAHSPAYAENARAFTAKLQAVHQAFEAGLKDCARREVVTSHAAFSYLARRYDLTVVPVMGLAPESEPSPAQLASIVRFAREKKVKYIFFETLVNPRLAETLAREVGARTLVFNPIEGLTRDEQAAGRGYVSLMEENLKNLRTALDCR